MNDNHRRGLGPARPRRTGPGPALLAALAIVILGAASCATEVHDETFSPFTHQPPPNEQTFTVRVTSNDEFETVTLRVAGVGSTTMTNIGGTDLYEGDLGLPNCLGAANFTVEIDTDPVEVFPPVGSWTHQITGLPAGCNGPVGQPKTFVVDTFTDDPDPDPGDGFCGSTDGGRCTLRAAVMEANAHPGDDLIRLPSRRYVLTRTGGEAADGVDDSVGDLDITDSVTIEAMSGANASIVDFLTDSNDGRQNLRDDPDVNFFYAKVDADGIDRVFQVVGGATLQLRQLAVVNGSTNSQGGGIRNEGTLTMERVALVENVHRSDAFNTGGAGIHNLGELLATDVAFTHNAAHAVNPVGGALRNEGRATIERALIAYNAARFGSAIRNDAGGELVVSNVTFAENRGSGGLINVISNAGEAELHYSTFARHNLDDRTLLTNESGGTMSAANNLIMESSGNLCSGTIGSNGGNVTSRPCTLTPSSAAGPDHIDVSVLDYGGLDDRGGFSPVNPFTRPSPGSSFFDPSEQAFQLRTSFFDQRGLGFPRSLDADGDGTATSDPGAWEAPE